MRELDVLVAFLTRMHLTNDSIAGLEIQEWDLPLLDEAVVLGWLEIRGIVQSLECRSCDPPHRVKVTPRGDVYILDCPRQRGDKFTRTDVAEYAPSLATILFHMQQASGSRASEIYEHAAGRLFDLGYIEASDEGPSWSALFGFSLDDENTLTVALDTLSKRLRSGPGLLVTADPLPRSMPLPKQYVLARPSDIWTLNATGLVLRRGTLASLLGTSPKRMTGAGRKNRLADVRRAVEILKQEHDWPPIQEDQWRLLKRHWKNEWGNRPERSTALVHLSTLSREQHS